MSLEITLTEDRPGDIPWILGRVNERPFKSRLGIGLSEDVLPQLLRRLEKKLDKRYGENTALVIRDTSGVDWDWDYVAGKIKDYLSKKANPYDMGIWVVNRTKDRLFRMA